MQKNILNLLDPLKFGIKYDLLITYIRRFEIFMKLNFYLHKL